MMGDYGESVGGPGSGGGDVYCEQSEEFAGVGDQQQHQHQQAIGGGGRRGGRRGAFGAGGGGDADSIVAPHPDFPTAKTLLIAFRRSRAFLERTARELLAGGTEYIMLSALGDAIPLAVQLQHALQAKKAAITLRIETVLVQARGSAAGAPPAAAQGGASALATSPGGAISPGLRIVMQRHPEFKGSRISPGYVMFMEQPEEGETPAYEPNPPESVACVNVGAPDLCLGSGRPDVFELLEREGFPVNSFKLLHAQLLAQALEESVDKLDADVKATVMSDTSALPEARLVICRPCMTLKDVDGSGALGSVFVTAFRDRFPHGAPKNSAMVYVVAPRLSHFGGASDKYLDAVTATATNLMTALCDFNGYIRREPHSGVPRIARCRVHLFPAEGGGNVRGFSVGNSQQERALRADIAKAILRGLDQGYRHGPSPRLSFAHEDNVFRQAWIETTGLDPTQQTPMTRVLPHQHHP